jgi:hypothetical protein
MFASRRRDPIVRKDQLSVLIGDIGEELRAQSVSEKQEPTSEGPLLQLPNLAFSRALEASSPRLQSRNESCECTRSPRHPVPSARRGSPTTDLPPQRTQLSPHRCGLRCAPKNPGVTAEGYEHGIVAPLDAAPVCRSATDSTRLHPGSFIQGVSHNRHILDCTRAERRRRFADTLNNTVLAVGSDDKMRQSRFGIHCSSHEADIRSKRTTPAFRIP